jgi:opacity protein-like surface antigen
MDRRWTVLLGMATALLSTEAVAAQDERFQLGPVRAGVGGNLVLALPRGELADQIDNGLGVAFNGHLNLVPTGALRLRLDGGFVQYGSETREVCFSSTVGCRIVLDLVTENTIFYGGLGPELMLPTAFVRPYVNAGIGFSYFETASRLEGDSDDESFARTRQHFDTGLTFTGGGGLYIPVHFGETPWAIDLSARYHRNGTISYLREGDIHDEPNGDISFTPTRTRADFVTVQVGVSVGLRTHR